MLIKNRVKELRFIPASQLAPNPKNWRTHPEKQMNALRGILAEIGFAGANLARELPDGTVMLIDGHARTELSGDSPIPVLILDVTELEADKILATFDSVGGLAEMDAERLGDLLKQLKEQNDILTPMVFPDYVIDPLMQADWTPPPVEEMPGPQERTHKVEFTNAQWEAVKPAIEKHRSEAGDATIDFASALVQIAEKFTAEAIEGESKWTP